ncbi:MAG: ABC transporter substrate-binding protein [Magnetococcales bacterium]|nr:ABC transporter substrate-binding protein [Magnetococcales bacterium]
MILIIHMLLPLTGCGDEEKISKELNIRLGWQANANSAGQIVALEKGYYARRGLKVNLYPGGLTNPSIQTVGSGKDNIGFANSPNQVIKAREAGVPLRIIAVIHQQGYHAFFSRQSAAIRTPQDWMGKRVGIKHGSPTYLYYLSTLRKFSIDRSTITEIPVKYDLLAFLEGNLDVYPGAITNEGVSLELQGLALSRLTMEDLGIRTWGNVIFTSEKMLRENWKEVRQFIVATLEGWSYCFEKNHEQEVMIYLKKHMDKMNLDKERRALELTNDLIRKRSPGSINLEDLQWIISHMHENGELKTPMDPSEVMDGSIMESILP